MKKLTNLSLKPRKKTKALGQQRYLVAAMLRQQTLNFLKNL